MKQTATREFYFQEPRLFMTVGGRALVRIIVNAAYGLITAAALVFIISDVAPIRAIGILLVLFLADRAMHFGRAEQSLARLPQNKVNIAHYLTPASYRLIEVAFERSTIRGGSFALNLIRALAERPEIKVGLERMDISPKDFLNQIEELLAGNLANLEQREQVIAEVGYLANEALSQALEGRSDGIEPGDIFAAIARLKEENIVRLMRLFNINEADLENAIIFGRLERVLKLRKPARPGSFMSHHFKARHRVMNRAWTARPTPVLDRFSEDLTDRARYAGVGLMIGHEQEYDRLVDVLSRPGNPNAILVGEPSVGKETVIEHLAFQIIKDRVPPPLFDRRLVAVSLGSLSAGAAAGELQERVKKILEEIVRAGNIILYIPDIHNLVKSGGSLQMSAADILVPAIRGTSFSVVGSTTPRGYKQFVEPVSDFASSFEVVRVDELTEPQATRYLVYQSIILENQYKIVIGFKAVKQAVLLAHKYLRQKKLPASAEDLLKETIADAVGKKKKVVASEDVIAIAERRINVPIHAVQKDEAEKLLNLEQTIHERLIDQEEAVSAVARAIREYRSGLTRRGGPIASFLFVGPTGVGKTELAKILTKIQFGDQNLMLRFDMSEYQDKQSFFRFIGSPDGSVRGALTDAVLEKPYSLVLLDEFEKAHPDILNLFLQVFDDGRLTDNMGRTVDFENTIIIATSNAHSEFIKTEIEQNTPVKEIAERLKRKLTDYFKAELLNRFSGIIVFKQLTPSDIEAIAKIQLRDLSLLLQENQGIDLRFSDAAAQEIAQLGFDPVFGARPLRKVISDRIRATLAEKILKRELSRGAAVIVDYSNEDFRFNQ